MKSRFVLGILVAAAAISSFAQTHSHPHRRHSAATELVHAAKMPMMDMKQCMADMAKGQAKLADLVAKMNGTQGAERIDATTATVNEMVTQEKAMQEMCMAMMANMGTEGGHAHGNSSEKHDGRPKKGGEHAGHHPTN